MQRLRFGCPAPPEPPQPTEFKIKGACDFPVLITQTPTNTGTAIGPLVDPNDPSIGRGFTLFAGRGITTFTNLKTDNQFTDVGGGSAFVRQQENGDLLVVARGHNSLTVPGAGIFLVLGRVTFTVAPPGTPGSQLTILEKQGRLIDVCARLA